MALRSAIAVRRSPAGNRALCAALAAWFAAFATCRALASPPTPTRVDAALPAPGDLPRDAFTRLTPGTGSAVFYPPNDTSSARPLAVMLHGMCALPEYECPVFHEGGTGAWLLCPPGPSACAGGGAMWAGADAPLAAVVDAASVALSSRYGAAIDPAPGALIGYSLGASAALRLIVSKPGRWSKLMIVNAPFGLSATQLARAGVARVALVAGERDATAGGLRRAAARLRAAGVDARFFALASMGHYFDASSGTKLADPMRWLIAAP